MAEEKKQEKKQETPVKSVAKAPLKPAKPVKAAKPAKVKPKIETKSISPIKVDKLSQKEIEEVLLLQGLLQYPLITEKAVSMIETQNKVSFIVAKHSTKITIKQAVEKLYGVTVHSVNVLKDMKGRKKAIVRLHASYKAQDIATRLGVI